MKKLFLAFLGILLGCMDGYSQSDWISFDLISGSNYSSFERQIPLRLPYRDRPAAGFMFQYYRDPVHLPFKLGTGLGYLQRNDRFKAGMLWVPLGVDITHGNEFRVTVGGGLDLRYLLFEQLDTAGNPDRDPERFTLGYHVKVGGSYRLSEGLFLTAALQVNADLTPYFHYEGQSLPPNVYTYRFPVYGNDVLIRLGIRKRL